MLSVIEGDYYFLDRDEQQQILQLAHSIMEGELEGLPLNQDDTPREHFINQELQAICLEENVLSIRSFMTFRLGKYYQRLRGYVEAAIDEYKMEQEYQTFIQSLRDYVTSKEPMLDHVHIVHDDHFVLWELKYISEREQKKYIDRRFVREHPMYIDSRLLAPLVSIAPKKSIFIRKTGSMPWFRRSKTFFRSGCGFFLSTPSIRRKTFWKSILDFARKTIYNTV